MTNKSFSFKIENKKYIFRIPGEGTQDLINRKQEYEVYKAITALELSDKIIYFNLETGVKISEFIQGCYNADPHNNDDLKLCMQAARTLHNSGIQVSHVFNFRERIAYYESPPRRAASRPMKRPMPEGEPTGRQSFMR